MSGHSTIDGSTNQILLPTESKTHEKPPFSSLHPIKNNRYGPGILGLPGPVCLIKEHTLHSPLPWYRNVQGQGQGGSLGNPQETDETLSPQDFRVRPRRGTRPTNTWSWWRVYSLDEDTVPGPETGHLRRPVCVRTNGGYTGKASPTVVGRLRHPRVTFRSRPRSFQLKGEDSTDVPGVRFETTPDR